MSRTSGLAGVTPQVAELWGHVDYQTTHLHAKWMIYRQLFGTSEARYELLMQAAHWAFSTIEQALVDDVQLSLAKLIDRTSGAAGFLALAKALRRMPIHDPWVRGEFEPKMAELASACKDVLDRRHDHIAHHSMAALVATADEPRLNPSRREIELALGALRRLMTCARQRFAEPEVLYDQVFLPNDGEALVEVVRRGLLLEKLGQEGVVAWHHLIDRNPPTS